jgi:hypothetical protein
MHQNDAFAALLQDWSLPIGLLAPDGRILKSKESMSVEKLAIFRPPR